MADKFADYTYDLLMQGEDAQERLEEEKRIRGVDADKIKADYEADPGVGFEGMAGGAGIDAQTPVDYNILMDLQLSGQEIDWGAVQAIEAEDMGFFPGNIWDITEPEAQAQLNEELMVLYNNVARETATRYLDTVSGIAGQMTAAGAMMHVTNPYAPEFEEVGQDTDLFHTKKLADSIRITPEEWESMGPADRVAIGVAALAMELPKYAAFLRTIRPQFKAPAAASTFAKNGISKRLVKLVGDKTFKTLRVAGPPVRQATGQITYNGIAEGLAFGVMTMVNNSGTLEPVLDEEGKDITYENLGKEIAWSLATGATLGQGGKIAEALRLPYLVKPAVPGSLMAGAAGLQGGDLETMGEAFTEMYIVGLLHPPNAKRVEKAALSEGKRIEQQAKIKQKVRKEADEIAEQAYEENVIIEDAKEAEAEGAKKEPKEDKKAEPKEKKDTEIEVKEIKDDTKPADEAGEGEKPKGPKPDKGGGGGGKADIVIEGEVKTEPKGKKTKGKGKGKETDEPIEIGEIKDEGGVEPSKEVAKIEGKKGATWSELEAERVELAKERGELKKAKKKTPEQKARLKAVKDRIEQIRTDKETAPKADKKGEKKDKVQQPGEISQKELNEWYALVEKGDKLTKKEKTRMDALRKKLEADSKGEGKGKAKGKTVKAGTEDKKKTQVKTRSKTAKGKAKAEANVEDSARQAIKAKKLSRLVLHPEPDKPGYDTHVRANAIFASLKSNADRQAFLDEMVYQTDGGINRLRTDKKLLNKWEREATKKGKSKEQKAEDKKKKTQKQLSKQGQRAETTEIKPVIIDSDEHGAYSRIAMELGQKAHPDMDMIGKLYKDHLGREMPSKVEGIASEAAAALANIQEGIFVKSLDRTISTDEGLVVTEGGRVVETVSIEEIKTAEAEAEKFAEKEDKKLKKQLKDNKDEVIEIIDLINEDVDGVITEERRKAIYNELVSDLLGQRQDRVVDKIEKLWLQALANMKYWNQRTMDSLTTKSETDRYLDVPDSEIVRHADAFTRELMGSGRADLVGTTIRGAADIAKLGNLLKAPFEISRVIFVKAGKIVHARTTSLNLPGVTKSYAPGAKVRALKVKRPSEYKRDAEYWFLQFKNPGQKEWTPMHRTFTTIGEALNAGEQQPKYFKTRKEAIRYWNRRGKKFFEDDVFLRRVNWMHEMLVETGADEIYFQHNHPFSPPLPSRPDMQVYDKVLEVARLQKQLTGNKSYDAMRETVITDHELYASYGEKELRNYDNDVAELLDTMSAERGGYSNLPVEEQRQIYTVAERNATINMAKKVDPLAAKEELNPYKPSKPDAILGVKVKGVDEISDWAQAYDNRKENTSVVFYLNEDSMVYGVESVPDTLLLKDGGILDILKQRAKWYGSESIAIYTTKIEMLDKKNLDMYAHTVIRDIVHQDGDWVQGPRGSKAFVPKDRPVSLGQLDRMGIFSDSEGPVVRNRLVSPSLYQMGEKSVDILHKREVQMRDAMEEVGEDKPAYYAGGRNAPLKTVDWGFHERQNKDTKKSRQAGIISIDYVAPTYFGKAGRKMGLTYKQGNNIIRLTNRTNVEDAFKAHGMAMFDLMVSTHKEDGTPVRGFGRTQIEEIRKLATTDRPSSISQSRSGFSEWFHRFIVDPELALEVAPKATKKFARAMLFPENLELAESIKEARALWEAVNTRDPIKWTGSFIRDRQKVKRLSKSESPRTTRKGDWITKWKDNLYYLWDLRKDVIDSGFKMNPSEDFALQAALARGSHGRAIQFLTKEQFQFSKSHRRGSKRVGRGLAQIMHPVDIQGLTETFSNYLFVKRVANDPKLIEGYQKADKGVNAEGYFKTSERLLEERYPAFPEIRKELDGYVHNLLVYLKEAGFIEQADIDRMEASNQFYIPLHTVHQEAARFMNEEKTGKINRHANLFDPLKRKTGKAAEVYDPIESLIQNTMTIMATADANRVGESLLKLHQAGNPIISKVFDVVPPGQRKITLDKDRIKKHLENSGLNEEELAMLDVKDLDIWQPVWSQGPKELVVRSEGKKYVLQFNDEAIYHALKGMDPMNLKGFWKGVQHITQIHRTTATAISYKFGVRNPFRDQVMSVIQTKFQGNVFSKIAQNMGGYIEAAKEGEIWDDFHTAGGGMATLLNALGKFDLETFHRYSQTPDAPFQSAAKSMLQKPYGPFNAIHWIGMKGEMGPRLAEFKRSMKVLGDVLGIKPNEIGEFVAEQQRGSKELRKMAEREGWDLKRFTPLDVLHYSGFAGREVTLDFARMGKTGRYVNTAISFWNANLEAAAKIIRTAKEDPTRAAIRAFSTITVPSVGLWFFNKDDENYTGLPLWRKLIMWNQPIYYRGKHIITLSVPKPWTLGIAFGSIPELALDLTYRSSKGDHVKGTAGTEISEALWQVGISAWPGILPTASVPLIEGLVNHSFFYNRPLVPQEKLGLYPFLQYRPWTSETAKLLGKYMSKVPGIGKFASPAKIDNFINGYLTGFGDILTWGVDNAAILTGVVDVPPKPKWQWTDLPLLDAISSRWPAPRTRPMENFYDIYNQFKTRRDSHFEIIGLRGNLQRLNPMVGLDGKYWKYSDEAVWSNLVRTHRTLDLMRDVTTDIWEDRKLTPERKRELLDAGYYLMNNIARVGIGQSVATQEQWQGKSELREIWQRTLDKKLGRDEVEIKTRK